MDLATPILPVLPAPSAARATVEQWASANPSFAALIQSGKPAPEALLRLGLQFLHDNHVPEAIDVFRAALALTPDDPVLWLNYGAALDRAGTYAEATGCLERSVALLHQQPDTWLLLGLVRQKLGAAASSEAAYRMSLQQDPNSFLTWQCLGLLKQQHGDFAVAIDCLTQCADNGGNSAALQANLGKLNYQLGRINEANAAYISAATLDPAHEHYRQMACRTRFIQDVIAGDSVDAALQAFTDASGAEHSAPGDIAALLKAALSHLSGFGHLDAAKRVGRKHLELDPGNRVVEYLLQAIGGASELKRSPPGFVVEHFNSFAEGFDAHLIGVLNYDVPEKICALVRDATPPGHRYDAIDVGCGTGLCGPFLRPLKRGLVGLDLAQKMLEQAARRGIYDTLVCEELTAYLARSPQAFDLITAADVMIYIGDLAPVFSSAATALRPRGLFAFSTE